MITVEFFDTIDTGESMNVTIDSGVSLKLGIIGTGQAGGRLAEAFYLLGYPTVAINTAEQDLALLGIPNELKLRLPGTLGGAGKELSIGQSVFQENKELVKQHILENLNDDEVQVYCVTSSLGGGSGSGSLSSLIQLCAELGKPVISVVALPSSFDDSQAKYNAYHSLADVAQLAQQQVLSSLILVDNSKIELNFPNLSQAKFWRVANNAVVKPLHEFNFLTRLPSEYESLDSMDFAKAFLESGNLCLIGSNVIDSSVCEDDEGALAAAVRDGLEKGLLVDGFDLKEASSVCVLVSANESVLENLSRQVFSFLFSYISEEYGSSKVFKGIYAIPDSSAENKDAITIRFLFGGLGLPQDKVDELKKESDVHTKKQEEKKNKTNMSIKKDTVAAKTNTMMNNIKKSNSPLGKLLNGNKK